MLDISERKHQEETREQLFNILAASPDLIATFDPEGKLLYINQSGCKLLGCENKMSLSKQDLWSIFQPSEVAMLLNAGAASGQTQNTWSGETQLITVNGDVIDVEQLIVKHESNVQNAQYYSTFMRDITARKRVQNESMLALGRLNAVLDCAADAIISIDENGLIDSFNPAAEHLFGFSEYEAVGSHITIIVPQKFRKLYRRIFNRFLQGREKRFLGQRLEIVGLGKNGNTFPLGISLSRVELGECCLIIAIGRDISLRKQQQAELSQHRDQLQEMVDLQTHDLIHAKNQAERANRTKSEFLANMSHELRTPMHAILSFSNFGIKKLDNVPNEKLGDYFKHINDSATRLMGLLNNLLDLAKLESGRMDFEMAENDLAEVLASCAAEQETRIDESHLTLEIIPPACQTSGYFDRVCIGQVITNLLSNAIKFTPKGKKISISMTDDRIATGRRKTDTENIKALRFTVRDQGIGIPENELKSVFDKFIQSSKTKSAAGGTGLGLSICKQIIDGHGGHIWADNAADGGAILSFAIPLSRKNYHRVRLNK